MRITKGKTYYDKPWYSSYRSMMDRCYREKAANYPRYGGRGITVCDEWHYIDVFGRWAEANGYKPGLTLDRIDPNGNYEPSNCRWATRKQQANNRTNTVHVTIDGVTKTLSEWAEFVGISRSTINNRYCDGVRGVMLLHRAEDTKFKEGYNRYGNSRHYNDYAPTVIPADVTDTNVGKKEDDAVKKEDYYHGICKRCGRPVIAKKEDAFWWPGGTTDDHLCIRCDVCDGLAEIWV